MYCRQCGNQHEENTRYCAKCGEGVSAASPPSYVPYSPPSQYPLPAPYPAYPYAPPQKKQTWWIWLLGGLGVFVVLIVVAIAASVASYNTITGDSFTFPPYTTGGAGQTQPPIGQDGRHALVGIWNWDNDPAWQYFFHPDGEGTRGGAGAPIAHFDWHTQGDVLYITTERMEERWRFAISGNQLTLINAQDPNMIFVYIRN